MGQKARHEPCPKVFERLGRAPEQLQEVDPVGDPHQGKGKIKGPAANRTKFLRFQAPWNKARATSRALSGQTPERILSRRLIETGKGLRHVEAAVRGKTLKKGLFEGSWGRSALGCLGSAFLGRGSLGFG